MKHLTIKNMEKAVNMIMAKGYDKNTAENIAINCFAMVSQFGETVEEYIRRID